MFLMFHLNWDTLELREGQEKRRGTLECCDNCISLRKMVVVWPQQKFSSAEKV